MKLFAIYVGGEMPGANIELHDMRFVVAPSIKETYPLLRQQWWGAPKSLHLDCWAELTHADGHDVMLRPEPYDGPLKLYFVNLGGYDPAEFAERHQNVFVVAKSEAQAKSRAMKAVKGWTDLHRDDMYEAEQAFCLNDAAEGARLHIHLTPGGSVEPLPFTCEYVPIGRKGG